ncbi:hypothetical protein DSM100238_0517 [Bifidobacterium apri]|uniref:Uncharacterized protein n=1 Tax=Bifidobacterium apri TaxID=1769423 RepID=A0A6A2VW84_9BIFI|nr:hypothetical protein DSM100238_0517 [Bifidobacterium apri]
MGEQAHIRKFRQFSRVIPHATAQTPVSPASTDADNRLSIGKTFCQHSAAHKRQQKVVVMSLPTLSGP